MLLLRLAAMTTWRLCTRRRLWMLVGVVGAAGGAMIIQEAQGTNGTVSVGLDGRHVVGSMYATGLTFGPLYLLGIAAAFVLPFALGDALAQDRRTHYTDLVHARGVSRPALFVAYVLSGTVVSAAAFGLAVVVWFVVAVASAPHLHGAIGPMVAHDVALLEGSPFAYFAAVTAVTALASGAVLALSHAVGAVTAWPAAAAVLPPILLFLGYTVPGMFGATAPESPFVALNPSERMIFVDSGAHWATIGSSAWYWLAAFLVTTACGTVIYTFREGS